jgi:uracil-DNA glycosylase
VVDPEVLVCLGATAVKAVIGPKARVMKDHAMRLLVGDLAKVRKRLDG